MNFNAITLALFLAVSQAFAASSPKVLSVWVFNLYQSNITRNKVADYFDYLAETTGYEVNVVVSNDIPDLLDKCKTGFPDIVIASTSITDRLVSGCNHTSIAQTFQSIYLFTRADGDLNFLKDVRKVGLIKGIKSSAIARYELELINPNVEYFEYKNLFDLIGNYASDQIDSVALALPFMSAAPFFEKSWRPIFIFDAKGSAVVTVRTGLDSSIVDRLKLEFLSNSENSVETWQTDVGLGAFVTPIQ